MRIAAQEQPLMFLSKNMFGRVKALALYVFTILQERLFKVVLL